MNKKYTNEKYANEDCTDKKYKFENSIARKTAFKRLYNKTKWKVHLTR